MRTAPTSSPRPRAPDAPTRRVLVTGAASFLGRTLVRLLADGNRCEFVVTADIEGPGVASDTLHHEPLDLTRPESEDQLAHLIDRHRVDTVVHLGFVSLSNRAPWIPSLEVDGTRRLVAAVRRGRPKRFILWSTTALYGPRPDGPVLLDEDSPLLAPRSVPRFAHRMAAEEQARTLGDQGCQVTTLRMAPMLGPHSHGPLQRYLASKVLPVLAGFDPEVQLLHEADAVAALECAVLSDAVGVFNVVADGFLSLSRLARLAGRAPVPVPAPAARAALGALWWTGAVVPPPALIDYLKWPFLADGTRARRQLGFVPAYSTRQAAMDFGAAQRVRARHRAPRPRRTAA